MKKILSLLSLILITSTVCHSQSIIFPREIGIILLDPQIRQNIFAEFKARGFVQPTLEIAGKIEGAESSAFAVELIFGDLTSDKGLIVIQVVLEKDHNFFRILKSRYVSSSRYPIPQKLIAFDSNIAHLLLNPIFDDEYKRAWRKYPQRGQFIIYRAKRSEATVEMVIGLEAKGKGFTFPREEIVVIAELRDGKPPSFNNITADVIPREQLPLVETVGSLPSPKALTPATDFEALAKKILERNFIENSPLTDEHLARILEYHLTQAGHPDLCIDRNSDAFRTLYRELADSPQMRTILERMVHDVFVRAIKRR